MRHPTLSFFLRSKLLIFLIFTKAFIRNYCYMINHKFIKCNPNKTKNLIVKIICIFFSIHLCDNNEYNPYYDCAMCYIYVAIMKHACLAGIQFSTIWHYLNYTIEYSKHQNYDNLRCVLVHILVIHNNCGKTYFSRSKIWSILFKRIHW